jgi:hypothetical protein
MSLKSLLEDQKRTKLIEEAIYVALDLGETPEDEARFALIEALLRDALGQNHGVWRWRVPEKYGGKCEELARRAMKVMKEAV